MLNKVVYNYKVTESAQNTLCLKKRANFETV